LIAKVEINKEHTGQGTLVFDCNMTYDDDDEDAAGGCVFVDEELGVVATVDETAVVVSEDFLGVDFFNRVEGDGLLFGVVAALFVGDFLGDIGTDATDAIDTTDGDDMFGVVFFPVLCALLAAALGVDDDPLLVVFVVVVVVVVVVAVATVVVGGDVVFLLRDDRRNFVGVRKSSSSSSSSC